MPLQASARHFPNSSSIWFGMILWIFHCAVVVTGIVALTLTFLVGKSYGIIFIGMAFAFAGIQMLRWGHSRSVSCPLCHGKVIHGSQCRKHREASRRRPFGYISSLFVDVALFGRFNCMYCGTPFRLKR
jgi:uncharacterized Zn-finger protein